MIIEQAQRALDAYRQLRQRTAPGALGAFYRSGGEELLYDKLPLSSRDLVVDAGGFVGGWSAEIMVRYGCRSLMFEPVPEFQERIQSRLSQNDRVELVRKGIGAKTEVIRMTIEGPGSRALLPGDHGGRETTATIEGVASVFAREELTEVGCMKINIEGAEYDLLDEILRLSLARTIRVFLIQFHDFDPSHSDRRARIQNGLAKSHRKIFDHPFVWERWDRAE